MQRLALFDLDNTLIDRQGELEEWGRAFGVARDLNSHAERVRVDALNERAYPSDFERLKRGLGLTASGPDKMVRAPGRSPLTGAGRLNRSRQQERPGSMTWAFCVERVTRIELAL
ncbi:hypothetical protein [Streptomyces chryseus]